MHGSYFSDMFFAHSNHKHFAGLLPSSTQVKNHSISEEGGKVLQSVCDLSDVKPLSRTGMWQCSLLLYILC
jgi:hypothetical protein